MPPPHRTLASNTPVCSNSTTKERKKLLFYPPSSSSSSSGPFIIPPTTIACHATFAGTVLEAHHGFLQGYQHSPPPHGPPLPFLHPPWQKTDPFQLKSPPHLHPSLLQLGQIHRPQGRWQLQNRNGTRLPQPQYKNQYQYRPLPRGNLLPKGTSMQQDRRRRRCHIFGMLSGGSINWHSILKSTPFISSSGGSAKQPRSRNSARSGQEITIATLPPPQQHQRIATGSALGLGVRRVDRNHYTGHSTLQPNPNHCLHQEASRIP